MITREDYLKALDIVEAYHKQLNVAHVGRSYKGFDELKIGDNVECVLVHIQNLKCLTKGKKYEVIDIYESNYRGTTFYIKDDRGKKKHYAKSNSQFKACV
jgi:hypothetical protein